MSGQHELQGNLLHGQHEHWVKLLHGTVVQGGVKVVSQVVLFFRGCAEQYSTYRHELNHTAGRGQHPPSAILYD
jgi:hypothetical protein